VADLLRAPILAAARNEYVKRVVAGAPVSRNVVSRFVAGERIEDAVEVSRQLMGEGLLVSLDHLGEDTADTRTAAAVADAYREVLGALAAAGLARGTEVSMKLSALGIALDPSIAYEHARRVCAAAREAGTTVTVDMEDHTTTDVTLEMIGRLRRDFPDVGAVLQAYLRRTEDDCRSLAEAGSRVRLCKGAYAEPESVAFRTRAAVDESFRRCLSVLMNGQGYPMVATHDPALIDEALRLAGEIGRAQGSYELQMLYGIRPNEQQRLAGEGEQVRVYVPYGTEWYGYLMRRLAERPANLTFFLRALASRS
jgi:proline dehydrogenase